MNFRTILKETTRPEHDRLDGLFSEHDIAGHDGFARFINTHLVCFEMMSGSAVNGSCAQAILCQMAQCLALDIDVLGEKKIQTGARLPADVNQLAIDYLVAGSRLGSKVLYKRWSASGDPLVRRASNYFNLDSDPLFWKSTCTALADISPDSARAHAVTRDTKILFELFATVYASTATREVATL